MMPITIISRLRNEELLLPDFLNHIDKFGSEFYFFDDCSTDNSYEILKAHPKTKFIIRNNFHNTNQTFVQTVQRHLLLELAKKNTKNKWIMLIEPDERIEFDFNKLEGYDQQDISGIYFKLFDSYMTMGDKRPYTQSRDLMQLRKYFGPEYREICFLFNKNKAKFDIVMAACRQPEISGETIINGLVKHYGKSLSVEQWEETADYYIRSVPMLAEKWKARKGKAIHKHSDFNRDLLTWNQIKTGKKEIVKI